MAHTSMLKGLFMACAYIFPASTVVATEVGDDPAEIQTTIEAALKAISNEDMIAFTDLMLDEVVLMGVGEREGEIKYSVRDRASSRAGKPEYDIEERGFDMEIKISGPLASVWLPYDLYIDGEWSHCGVDAFTLIKTPAGWRMASMVWSREQPPACRKHPDGPPGS